MLTLPQKAWAAGVIDLKGRIVYKNNKMRRTRQTVLMVESKNMVIIRKLCELTGTNAEAERAKPLSDFLRKGCAEHCPETHVHVGFDALKMPAMGRWTVTGASMVTVLYNVLPYLADDRGYTVIMNEVVASTRLIGQGSSSVVDGLRRLDSLGWDIPACFRGENSPLALTAA